MSAQCKRLVDSLVARRVSEERTKITTDVFTIIADASVYQLPFSQLHQQAASRPVRF